MIEFIRVAGDTGGMEGVGSEFVVLAAASSSFRSACCDLFFDFLRKINITAIAQRSRDTPPAMLPAIAAVTLFFDGLLLVADESSLIDGIPTMTVDCVLVEVISLLVSARLVVDIESRGF